MRLFRFPFLFCFFPFFRFFLFQFVVPSFIFSLFFGLRSRFCSPLCVPFDVSWSRTLSLRSVCIACARFFLSSVCFVSLSAIHVLACLLFSAGSRVASVLCTLSSAFCALRRSGRVHVLRPHWEGRKGKSDGVKRGQGRIELVVCACHWEGNGKWKTKNKSRKKHKKTKRQKDKKSKAKATQCQLTLLWL